MRNTIDTLAPSTREELLNYFSSWTELKQGDMEKLLTHSMNFEYLHYDMMVNTGQFEEVMKFLSLLFEQLASLSYIGTIQDTGIFIEEQKTKRSFLAD